MTKRWFPDGWVIVNPAVCLQWIVFNKPIWSLQAWGPSPDLDELLEAKATIECIQSSTSVSKLHTRISILHLSGHIEPELRNDVDAIAHFRKLIDTIDEKQQYFVSSLLQLGVTLLNQSAANEVEAFQAFQKASRHRLHQEACLPLLTLSRYFASVKLDFSP
jgi:hypothetical protein